MNAYIRSIAISSMALALSAAATAQSPVGARFTYQGTLKDGGNPAGGTYDFAFRLFDAVTLGAQIGGVDAVENLPVTDGLFTVALNDSNEFGPGAFAGDARWLEIAVRPGASSGAYTTLTPRQPLTAAPYALYALNGGHWNQMGAAITNTNDGFVGINRTTAVSAAESFGIQAQVETGYGGMYIRTDGTAALPFYGYKAGLLGNSAWTYLDGATGNWHVNNGGNRLTVEDTGDVGIGTTDPTAKLHVSGDVKISTGPLIIDGPYNSSANSLLIYTNTSGDAANIWNDGAGDAGVFQARNGDAVKATILSGSGTAVHAVGSTNGDAGYFEARNGIGVSALIANNGGGIAVNGTTTGNGRGGSFHINNASSNGTALYCKTTGTGLAFHADGTARVGVLEITGADVAEKFPVSDEVKPGMVVMIDADNAGKLCASRGAYNARVAGVVSGANGLPAGTILGHLPGNEDAPPIALSGRVWTMCDATGRAIDIGDSLTTAERPGHAMAAPDRARAGGATIGKAMTALPKGEVGLVLVLVNLQ